MIVPIGQLVPHPLNPNIQSPDVKAKIKRHIELSKQYPAIIVRDLSNSAEFGHLAPQYQILDGQHRWAILKELGYTEVKVDCFGALTDKHAELLLATLNPLRGKDDPRKRASLLDMLRRRFNNDLSQVSTYVPESVEQLSAKVEIVSPRGTATIQSEDDDAAGKFDTFYALVTDEMKKVIDTALKVRRSQGNLPGEPMAADASTLLKQDYDRGRALADICAQWFLTQTQ